MEEPRPATRQRTEERSEAQRALETPVANDDDDEMVAMMALTNRKRDAFIARRTDNKSRGKLPSQRGES